MASSLDGVLEIAMNSNWFFTDTRADDFVIRTQASTQNIAIGVQPNEVSAIYITSNAVNINQPVNITGGFYIVGQSSNPTKGAYSTDGLNWTGNTLGGLLDTNATCIAYKSTYGF